MAGNNFEGGDRKRNDISKEGSKRNKISKEEGLKLFEALSGEDTDMNIIERAFKDSREEVLNSIKQEIVNQAIEQVKTKAPFTHGKEGEVYKVNIELYGVKEELLIVKRLYTKKAEIEFQNQKNFFLFFEENLSQLGIKAPAPITNFENNGEEFIIMEEVKGKTLYNMIWEGIINQILIKEIYNKLNSSTDGGNKRIRDWIDGYIENYNVLETETESNFSDLYKKFNVSFPDDTTAEEAAKEVLEIYNNVFSTDYSLENIYKKNLYRISLFEYYGTNKISYRLKEAIKYMNNNGYYHRDLGGNPRNIMFNYQTDDIYLIDFGNSLIDSHKNSESAFYNQINDGKYDKDIDITTAYIDKLGGLENIDTGNLSRDAIIGNFSKSDFNDLINQGLPKNININNQNLFDVINSKTDSNVSVLLKNEIKDQIFEKENSIGDRKISLQPKKQVGIDKAINGFEKFFTMIFQLNYDELIELKDFIEGLKVEESKQEKKRQKILSIIENIISKIDS